MQLYSGYCEIYKNSKGWGSWQKYYSKEHWHGPGQRIMVSSLKEKVCFMSSGRMIYLLNTLTVPLTQRAHTDVAGCCCAVLSHLLAKAELHRLVYKGRNTQKCLMRAVIAKEIFCIFGIDFNWRNQERAWIGILCGKWFIWRNHWQRWEVDMMDQGLGVVENGTEKWWVFVKFCVFTDADLNLE